MHATETDSRRRSPYLAKVYARRHAAPESGIVALRRFRGLSWCTGRSAAFEAGNEQTKSRYHGASTGTSNPASDRRDPGSLTAILARSWGKQLETSSRPVWKPVRIRGSWVLRLLGKEAIAGHGTSSSAASMQGPATHVLSPTASSQGWLAARSWCPRQPAAGLIPRFGTIGGLAC